MASSDTWVCSSRRAIERRVDHLALHRPLHIGHLFGSFVHEDDHQVTLRVVGRDRVGDLLEHGRLARLGWRNDQTALTLADGGNQIDDARKDVVGLALHFEMKPDVGKQWGEVTELDPVLGFFRINAVHGERAHQCRKLLLGPRRPNRSGADVALAESMLSNLVGGDVHVLLAGKVTGAPQEPVALGKDVEYPLSNLELGLVDGLLRAATTAPAATLPLTSLTVLLLLARSAPIAVPVAPGTIPVAFHGGDQRRLGGGLRNHCRIEILRVEDRRDQLRLLNPLVVDVDFAGHRAQIVESQFMESRSRRAGHSC